MLTSAFGADRCDGGHGRLVDRSRKRRSCRECRGRFARSCARVARTSEILIGRLPAMCRREPADQDLLELFASEMAAAIRNAQLFAQVESQNRQLLELDAAKDDFLRGVSHNLQTPLTSIRAYAEQLDASSPDRRLGIIAEQSERLSRMVRQLLTVTRLESGALKPRSEVVSLATRVRKAWEALGVDDVEFELDDRAAGWLAIADPDQLDQVLWALLDNAVKYGDGTPVGAAITVDSDARRMRLTISDRGPGVADADRGRLFTRFERGGDPAPDGGSGLGFYVARELCRAMGGELTIEPSEPGSGCGLLDRLAGLILRRGLSKSPRRRVSQASSSARPQAAHLVSSPRWPCSWCACDRVDRSSRRGQVSAGVTTGTRRSLLRLRPRRARLGVRQVLAWPRTRPGLTDAPSR